MLLIITAFVMTSTMAWAAVERVNNDGKRNLGFRAANPGIVGFASL